jgi:hypothetical protein
MADTAPQVQYRKELVAEFEEGSSWLRQTVTTEAVINGLQATFLVAGSGGASAVTRGINGLIPARADNNVQTTVTLVEWHDLVRKSRFNIFQSQGNQRRLMQETCRKVLNRKLDADIIGTLDTASNNMGGAATMTLAIVAEALTTLAENEIDVQEEDKMFAVMSPAVRGYLMQTSEWNSADYVEMKPLVGPARRLKRWAGFNWIFHPNLTGVASVSEKCYFYHKDAVGSAFESNEGLKTAIGYDDEQDYSYARASSFTGSAMLQQSGVLQFLHNGAAI